MKLLYKTSVVICGHPIYIEVEAEDADEVLEEARQAEALAIAWLDYERQRVFGGPVF